MRSFDTQGPVRLVLDIPSGRIEVIAEDRTDATVEAVPVDEGRGRDVKAAGRLSVEFAAGELRILAGAPRNQYVGPSGSVKVTAHVPAGSHLRGTAGGCELHTLGRLGEVSFEGAYRSISVQEAESLRLTAVDGDVEVGHLAGPAQITTARGAIRIAEAASGTLELRTQMGEISVGTVAGASATLAASTGRGRVHNALKNTEGAAAPLHIHATTNQGDITARSL